MLQLLVVSSFGVHPACTIDATHVCSGVPINSTAEAALLQGCTLCGTPNCSNASPSSSTNYSCVRTTKQCRICGDVSASAIATVISTGYTIRYQRFCDTTVPCGQLTLDTPILFQDYDELTISGQALNVPCPLVFKNIKKLHLRNLDITCASNFQKDTRPGIEIQAQRGVELDIESVSLHGLYRTAMLVYGGDFSGVPPVTSTDLTGTINGLLSNFTGLSVDPPVLFAAASFFSSTPLQFFDITPHSRIVVQPRLPPNGGTTSEFTFNDNSHILVNLSALIMDFGETYETMFYNENAYSKVETESNDFGRSALLYQSIAFGVLGTLIAVLHSDVFYYYSHSSVLKE